MAKINDTNTFPITTPARDDMLLGTDVSDVANDANGETVNFTVSGLSALFGLQSVQVFTSSGTWTRPAGVNKVLVFVTGGGDDRADGETGGGSGATAIKFLDVSAISSATITVGNNSGGDSSWVEASNTITGGGASSSGAGTATGGDLNLQGQGGSGTSTRQVGGSSFWGGGYGAGAQSPAAAQPGVVFILEFA